jgi:superfamily II DNA or RNA helicase
MVSTDTATYAPGSLVTARRREWVVLPDSTPDLLLLRPLAGADTEVAGVVPALEDVRPARFDWPDPARAGDHSSARLLRDAARLGFRSSAGPFRSFAEIAVEPRPYQAVPLLMALRLDPVRLLIADDVGIGKTIEAALIAKELLVTGAARRLAVLCPPHLAEQWQAELADKFNIATEAVLSSTATRLERRLPFGTSIFEAHPATVVSTDFIKSERRRHDFLRPGVAPDLIIVDEAHTCAVDVANRSTARQQRHQLLQGLAADPARHLLLVTATPHSGNEGAFRSLISLLGAGVSAMADAEETDATARAQLARHFVQRRRADIRQYLDTETPFPERLDLPENAGQYQLSPAYKSFVDDVIAWARQTVNDETGGRHRQRVRWWGVLALLRALASSPAAAAATLRNRAAPATTTTVEEADEVGRAAVLDLDEADDAGRPDAAPGADPDPEDGSEATERRRLRQLARAADSLAGDPDNKLIHTIALVKRLVADGANPIVFCRFIPTAEYVAEHLRTALGNKVAVEAVTGLLVPSDREERVETLAQAERRVLVATDCLSEGINLQHSFDAVVHYDLPWNPTRLEQREGRVDRYGQASPSVRVATVYGTDNLVDEIVLDVLLRKHKAIRNRLGVSIPVPGSNDEFIETVFDRIFHTQDEQLSLFTPEVQAVQASLFDEWERAAERERVSRTRYAQHTISTSEVAAELADARAAVGSSTDVARFAISATRALGGHSDGDGFMTPIRLVVDRFPRPARDRLGTREPTVVGRFEPTLKPGETYLGRTSPLVTGLAGYVLDGALEGIPDAPAARCGAIRTDAVTTTTTLLLIRQRFDISIGRGANARHLLAEDLDIAAFEGSATEPHWLEPDAAEGLLESTPGANIPAEQRQAFIQRVLEGVDALTPALAQRAEQRAVDLEATHRRIRQQARDSTAVAVTPHLPADVLGVYVCLPL